MSREKLSFIIAMLVLVVGVLVLQFINANENTRIYIYLLGYIIGYIVSRAIYGMSE